MGWRCEQGMMHGKPQRVLMEGSHSVHSVACDCVEDWNPSTDIVAAMEVVEKIGMLFYLIWQPRSPTWVYGDTYWRATFRSLDGREFHASAETPTEAICRAALLVSEGKHD